MIDIEHATTTAAALRYEAEHLERPDAFVEGVMIEASELLLEAVEEIRLLR